MANEKQKDGQILCRNQIANHLDFCRFQILQTNGFFFNSVVCLTELRINICGHKLVSSNKHRNTTVCEQIFRTLVVEGRSISMSHKQANAVCPVVNGLSLVKHIFRCMCRSPSGCRRSLLSFISLYVLVIVLIAICSSSLGKLLMLSICNLAFSISFVCQNL